LIIGIKCEEAALAKEAVDLVGCRDQSETEDVSPQLVALLGRVKAAKCD
jgi:hypothetical protein